MRESLMIWGRIAVMGTAALLLVGCAGRMSPDPTFDQPTTSETPSATVSPAPFARLDTPQAAKDRLPSTAGPLGVVRESSRLLAHTAVARYYGGRSKAGWYCLVIVPKSEDAAPASACGAGLAYGPLQTQAESITAILAADDDPAALDRPGFVRVAKNLAVKETGS